MSYENINPAFYEMFQPDTPFHAGAPGWTEAPYPSWGNNPVEIGPRMLAIDGLGYAQAVAKRRNARPMAGCNCGPGVGDAAAPDTVGAKAVSVVVGAAVILALIGIGR